MTLAKASMAESIPKPNNATDPASIAARIATQPSMPNQHKLIQLSRRARRTSTTHSALPGRTTAAPTVEQLVHPPSSARVSSGGLASGLA